MCFDWGLTVEFPERRIARMIVSIVEATAGGWNLRFSTEVDPLDEIFSSSPASLGRRARLLGQHRHRHHDAAVDEQAAHQKAESIAQRNRSHAQRRQLVLADEIDDRAVNLACLIQGSQTWCVKF